MGFSENLRKAREENEISQAELAEKLGISQTAIYSYEKGSKVPNVVLGCLIAEKLGLTCEELVGIEKER